MNLRGFILMEVVHKDMPYHLHLPVGAQYVDCLEVLEQMKNNVVEMQRIAQEQEQQKVAQAEPEAAQPEPEA